MTIDIENWNSTPVPGRNGPVDVFTLSSATAKKKKNNNNNNKK
jgi:hypothetical protein